MFFYREFINNNNNAYSLNLNLGNIIFSDTLLNGQATGSVTISATGQGTETITLSDDSNQFTALPASFNLAGGSSQVITLIFTPTTGGNQTGTVNISASGGSTAQLTLSGSGSQFVETQALFGTAVTNSADIYFNANTTNISNDGTRLFVGAESGQVHIYKKISGSFELEHLIEVSPNQSEGDIRPTDCISCNEDGSIFVVGLNHFAAPKIKIYENVSGSYTLLQTIIQENLTDFGHSVVMSLDANTIIVRDLHNLGSSHIYVRNNSLWQHQQTISLSDYLGRTVYSTGGPIRINSIGDRLFLGCENEQASSEIHVFNKVSGTWNYSTGITQTPSIWTSQFPTLTSSIYLSTTGSPMECASINSSGDRLAIRVQATEELGPDAWPIRRSGVVIYNSSSAGWDAEQVVTGNLTTLYAPRFGAYHSFNASGDILTIFSGWLDINGKDLNDPDFIISSGVTYVYVKNPDSWALSQILTSSINTDSPYYGEAHRVLINSSGNNIFIANRVVQSPDQQYQGVAFVFQKQ
jgi:hypothetical protein